MNVLSELDDFNDSIFDSIFVLDGFKHDFDKLAVSNIKSIARKPVESSEPKLMGRKRSSSRLDPSDIGSHSRDSTVEELHTTLPSPPLPPRLITIKASNTSPSVVLPPRPASARPYSDMELPKPDQNLHKHSSLARPSPLIQFSKTEIEFEERLRHPGTVKISASSDRMNDFDIDAGYEVDLQPKLKRRSLLGKFKMLGRNVMIKRRDTTTSIASTDYGYDAGSGPMSPISMQPMFSVPPPPTDIPDILLGTQVGQIVIDEPHTQKIIAFSRPKSMIVRKLPEVEMIPICDVVSVQCQTLPKSRCMERNCQTETVVSNNSQSTAIQTESTASIINVGIDVGSQRDCVKLRGQTTQTRDDLPSGMAALEAQNAKLKEDLQTMAIMLQNARRLKDDAESRFALIIKVINRKMVRATNESKQ